MSRTIKDKPYKYGGKKMIIYGVSKATKEEARHKRKTYKNLEITGKSNYLNKLLADRWNHD